MPRRKTTRFRVMYSVASIRVGFSFGRRTVVWTPEGRITNMTYVRVRCFCGEEDMVRVSHIQTGESPSCGSAGCRPSRARNGPRASIGALRLEGNGDVALAAEPPLHQIAWMIRNGVSVWDAIGGAHQIDRRADATGRGRPPRQLTINGRTQTALEWAEEAGIPVKTLLLRVNRRWPKARWLEPVRSRPRRPRVQSVPECPLNGCTTDQSAVSSDVATECPSASPSSGSPPSASTTTPSARTTATE